MTTPKWHRIESLYHEALAQSPEARATFLRDACGDDEFLRREVESLLAHAGAASGFLNEAAVDAAANLMGADSGSLSGRQIGVYRIESLLGAGGMGEVYRARDTKLGRDVAFKVLPSHLTTDSERLARFEREARVLATLNHPHIAAIYGFEHKHSTGEGQAPVQGLVLELVEGETLADLIRDRRAVGVKDAVDIARQIIDALDAAHEKGIVHRDLKPANIKVTPEGSVKVLDFGLAKAAGADSMGDMSQSPTITRGATHAGMVLGTAAYMSPEQARGKPVDKRTDIWAFGCVLYEMLAGQPAFPGETVSDTIAAILERTPDWSALPAGTPVNMRRLLDRCLEKDLKRRLRDIFEATELLNSAPAQVTSGVRSPIGAWVTACVMTAVAASAVGWWAARRAPAPPAGVSRLMIDVRPATGLVGTHPLERSVFGRWRPSRTVIAISPDGRTLAFAAHHDGHQQLYLREFGKAEATAVPGTENADIPFFSPDGAWLGFWSGDALRKVSTSGGSLVKICDTAPLAPAGVSWNEPDRIVFGQLGTIWRVAAGGGVPEQLTKAEPDEASHVLPQVLPGGKTLLYTALRGAGNWEHSRIIAESLDTKARRILLEGAADARYVPTGHLLYLRLGKLIAAQFDPARALIQGGETTVADSVMQAINSGASGLDTASGQYAFSAAGTLIYADGGVYPDFQGVLQWIRRDGSFEPVPMPPEPRPFMAPRLSPDGRAFVVGTIGLNEQSVWRYDFADRKLLKLTTEGHPEYPVWTPDGKTITVSFALGSHYGLFNLPADGSATPVPLTSDAKFHFPGVWTPDGVNFVHSINPPQDIVIIDRANPPVQRPLLESKFSEREPDISPDGRWIAYVSNETGRNEVFVQAFPGLGHKHQISQDGATVPAWSRDGRRLWFVSPHDTKDGRYNRMMEVDVSYVPDFAAGPQRVLFEMDDKHYPGSVVARTYDVSADGSRFLTVREEHTPAVPVRDIHVIENWFSELKH